MLFVKNMVFLDGAIATLAPDLDIFAEIANIVDALRREATASGSPAELRRRPDAWQPDMAAFKASIGLDQSATGLTYREIQQRREPPSGPASTSRRRRRSLAVEPPCGWSIARCSVDYDGRLSAHLPTAVRLLMVKADGCVVVHADGGAYKPLNWMTPRPADRGPRPMGRRQRLGRAAHHHDRGGAVGHQPRSRHRSGLCEGRRGGSPPGAAGRRTARRSRSGCGWCAASTRPTSGRSTSSATTPTGGRWRSRSSVAARSTASSSSPATSSAWTATPGCARCAASSSPRSIKPQARVVAEARGITCVEVDYDELRGVESRDLRLF